MCSTVLNVQYPYLDKMDVNFSHDEQLTGKLLAPQKYNILILYFNVIQSHDEISSLRKSSLNFIVLLF